MKQLIVLTLILVGTYAAKWDAIENMEEMIRGQYTASKTVIQSIDSIMKNTSDDASIFLNNLEDLSVVKEVKAITEEGCKDKLVDLKDLKRSFRVQYADLARPLVKRVSDIEGLFGEMRASLAVHQGLADAKWWACKMNGLTTECLSLVQNWVSDRMQSLQCKMTSECGAANHTVAKREISAGNICGRNRYYYKGSCRDINSYTCDSSCNAGYYNCFDEPSSDCTKYCVGGFHCNNLKCIDKSEVCDGSDDCGDGSDEEDCKPREIPPSNCSLEAGKFLCSDKSKCVDLWRSCDGTWDCADGSDEDGSCGTVSCGPECSVAGGVCMPTPRGSVCLSRCPPGTEETADGCRPGPALPPSTLAGLLEDVPRLTARYLSGFKLLQNRVVDELSASLARVSQCLDRPSSLDGILTMSGYMTSPKPPHTTTKRHTTTHRTTTPRMEETSPENVDSTTVDFYGQFEYDDE